MDQRPGLQAAPERRLEALALARAWARASVREQVERRP
jgi:hypothetical protein